MRGEIEARIRDQLERVLAGMDLVSREEFEAVKAMAAKAREEQEMLLRRLDALEARGIRAPAIAAPVKRTPKTLKAAPPTRLDAKSSLATRRRALAA